LPGFSPGQILQANSLQECPAISSGSTTGGIKSSGFSFDERLVKSYYGSSLAAIFSTKNQNNRRGDEPFNPS
jgi:hypothetical protein